LLVGLNTGAAGVFGGTASIGFQSQNTEMADLALGPQLVSLMGQVNNLANPEYGLLSGLGNLTSTGDQFVLDLGTLRLGSAIDGVLRLMNAVSGPADDLRGSFAASDPIDFGLSGWSSFSGLGAGDILGGLGFSFDARSLGSFEDVITLSGFSFNASDPDGIRLGRTLTIRATVIDQDGTVPEPGTLSLMLLVGLFAAVAQRHRQRHASRC
jgi:hypothetical protein